jgi:hypothetical protein
MDINFLNRKCFKKGDDFMAKKENYLTNAPKKVQVTINNGSIFPNSKNVPGDSVDQHKSLEEANSIITGDEIRQQNENL